MCVRLCFFSFSKIANPEKYKRLLFISSFACFFSSFSSAYLVVFECLLLRILKKKTEREQNFENYLN